MATKPLDGKRIAFLATDGFEQVELTSPWLAVEAADAARLSSACFPVRDGVLLFLGNLTGKTNRLT